MSAIDEDFRMHTQPKSEKEMVLIDPAELAQLRADNERMKAEYSELRIKLDSAYHMADVRLDKIAKLRAELDAKTKAVEEARFILSQIDYWADSDWELLANAWLTAHPEGKE